MLWVALPAVPAAARPGILSDWQAQYPISQSDENAAGAGSACQLCHTSSNGGDGWNAYGWSIRQTLNAMPVADNIAAFLAVEALNADGDPAIRSNFDEILLNTQPGWTEGNSNTTYVRDGTATEGVAAPPGILGMLDPEASDEPFMQLTPGAIDFGFVLVSGPAATQQVEILNLGNATLHVSGVALCDGTSGEFSVPPTAFDLALGEVGVIEVTYAPEAPGLDAGCLEIASNDTSSHSAGGIATIDLIGEGVAALVDVDISGVSISRRANLDRGEVVSIDVNIQNAGAAEGSVDVEVSAVQNGVEVYREELSGIASGPANAITALAFPDYPPTRLGEISWNVAVTDANPDLDEVMATTTPASHILGEPLDDPIRQRIKQGRVSVNLERVASGLVAPNYGITAPGVPGNILFVVDQVGSIWKIDLDAEDPDASKSRFADVSSYLVPLGLFGPGTFDERGLLGVAFHPDYATNGLVYTYTSEPLDGAADFSTMPAGHLADHQSVVAEWPVSNPADPMEDWVLDTASRRVLLRVDQPQFNHDGGAVVFGPDGLLYISFGDGGSADDQDGQPFIGGAPTIGHGPIGNGQDITSPLGAILRIDPQGSDSANGQYGIPANPLVGLPGAVEEIFAWGFRNPWRIAFDRLTGDLWTADVGQNDIEEVDRVVWGGNYGWKLFEGTFVFDDNGTGSGFVTDQSPRTIPGGPFVAPVAEYDHDDGLSVTGGFVYRGSAIPELEGRFVFGDWSRSFGAPLGRMFYYNPTNSRLLELRLGDREQLALYLNGFGEDAVGELYIMVGRTGTPFGTTGEVYRIIPTP